MPTDVIMPQMGESIFEGTLTKWLKKPGDKIQRDEPLFEISTDKVDAEIPAPASGVLKEIKVQEGTTVQVNTVVGVIDAEGAAVSASAPAPRPEPAKATYLASCNSTGRADARQQQCRLRRKRLLISSRSPVISLLHNRATSRRRPPRSQCRCLLRPQANWYRCRRCVPSSRNACRNQ